MQLYYSPTSPYARKARIVLIEKGVAFEAVDASSDSVDAHNPLGKVPTLVLNDGGVLFDSRVITEALDALYPEPRLIPESLDERAAVRRWEALADGVCDVLIPVIVDSRRPPTQQNPEYTTKLLGKVRACLAYLEKAVSRRRFLAGEQFTLADIAVSSMAGYIKLRRPELLEEGYPELKRYLAGQLERTSIADTVPPNLPIRA
jgi:glutathione S-transferase